MMSQWHQNYLKMPVKDVIWSHFDFFILFGRGPISTFCGNNYQTAVSWKKRSTREYLVDSSFARTCLGCYTILRYDWVIIETRENVTGMSLSFANENSHRRVNSSSHSPASSPLDVIVTWLVLNLLNRIFFGFLSSKILKLREIILISVTSHNRSLRIIMSHNRSLRI